MNLGPVAMKTLRFAHLLLVILFVGGVAAATALVFSVDGSNAQGAFAATSAMKTVFDNIVRIGSVGTVLVGLCYGFLTKWGFFRHRWLLIKWVILIGQVSAGILIVDRAIENNVGLLDRLGAKIISSPTFLGNLTLLKFVLIAEVVASVAALAVANWRFGGANARHGATPLASG